MPPALIKRCPREPFSKPESKESAYSACTLTDVSPEATWEKPVKLATRVACGRKHEPREDQILFCPLHNRETTLGHLAEKAILTTESLCGLGQNPPKPSTSVPPSRRMERSVYPRDVMSQGVWASGMKCKSWSVLV